MCRYRCVERLKIRLAKNVSDILSSLTPEWLFIYSIDFDAPDHRPKEAAQQLDSFGSSLLPLGEGIAKITLHSVIEDRADALTNTYFALRFALRDCVVEPAEITEVFARHISDETNTRRLPHVQLSHMLTDLDLRFTLFSDSD